MCGGGGGGGGGGACTVIRVLLTLNIFLTAVSTAPNLQSKVRS